MNSVSWRNILIVIGLAMFNRTNAQIVLVTEAKSDYCIVLSKNAGTSERKAAEVLRQ